MVKLSKKRRSNLRYRKRSSIKLKNLKKNKKSRKLRMSNNKKMTNRKTFIKGQRGGGYEKHVIINREVDNIHRRDNRKQYEALAGSNNQLNIWYGSVHWVRDRRHPTRSKTSSYIFQITNVKKGSSAYNAGLRKGHIIEEVNFRVLPEFPGRTCDETPKGLWEWGRKTSFEECHLQALYDKYFDMQITDDQEPINVPDDHPVYDYFKKQGGVLKGGQIHLKVTNDKMDYLMRNR